MQDRISSCFDGHHKGLQTSPDNGQWIRDFLLDLFREIMLMDEKRLAPFSAKCVRIFVSHGMAHSLAEARNHLNYRCTLSVISVEHVLDVCYASGNIKQGQRNMAIDGLKMVENCCQEQD